jgi:hypothetical protein
VCIVQYCDIEIKVDVRICFCSKDFLKNQATSTDPEPFEADSDKELWCIAKPMLVKNQFSVRYRVQKDPVPGNSNEGIKK